jgi:hypothetical protein
MHSGKQNFEHSVLIINERTSVAYIEESFGKRSSFFYEIRSVHRENKRCDSREDVVKTLKLPEIYDRLQSMTGQMDFGDCTSKMFPSSSKVKSEE